jgi:hypothetical protein
VFLLVQVCCIGFTNRNRGGEEEKRKREASKKGPGMPELGEGLRYELEPGTKMATPSENRKESCIGRYTASTGGEKCQ